MYRFILPKHTKPYFEAFVMYCNINYGQIPLTFVLAFYMNNVVQRWWETWKSIPWPDGLALKLNTLFPNFPGKEETCMNIKRTIIRYVNLSITETFRMISSPVKKRFPTYQHLIDSGLMTNIEMEAIEIAQEKSEFMNTFYWLPLNWAGNLLIKMEKEGMICRRYVAEILSEINSLRGRSGDLLAYDWINVPIIYTQIVTIAVYSYFAAALFGRQTLDISDGKTIIGYKNIGGIFNIVPLYLTLEFLFFVGWLKVAEVLINPYGEDDDDFETNYMIDRNLQICYLFVDEVGQNPPEVGKDPHWNIGIPKELPHTIASLPFRNPNLETGAENLTIPIEQHKTIAPEDIENYKKSSAIRNVSMRLNTAIGLNNIVKLVANPMIDRNQRLSDCTFTPRRKQKIKVSTISSPTLMHKPSTFKLENETKLSFKEKPAKRIDTMTFAKRIRKEGLCKDALDIHSSEDTLRKKVSNLLWNEDSQNLIPNTDNNSKDEYNDVNKTKSEEKAMESKKSYNVTKEENRFYGESWKYIKNTAMLDEGNTTCEVLAENSHLNEAEAPVKVLHPGVPNTPAIRVSRIDD